MKEIIKSLRTILVFAVILGILYPLVMTGISTIAFKSQAEGSLVYSDNKLVGSNLIGQNFSGDMWFHGRPSASSYDGLKSGGTNLAMSNPDFKKNTEANIDSFLSQNPGIKKEDIPADIVTASASGLDPEISVDAAYLQAKRVAAENGMTEEQVKSVIDKNKSGKFINIFGQDRVNVLKLNIDILNSRKK